ncbi:MAG: fliS [Oscillospiraceae bacterium]|jgi:flagellar protein FliS|nr:fliS [Oscillospiraceae bacterium]
MNNTKAYLNYVEQSGMTATPGELLLMLWNAEIKNIKIAVLNIKSGNLSEAHEKLIRAQDIVDELILSLDDRYEISKNLTNLYTFIKNELVLANLKKDSERLEAILPLVTEMRDTWEQANKISRMK